MRCCPRLLGHGIEAAHKGPLGVADTETRRLRCKAFEECVRCRRWCHMLGVDNTRCSDKELRQWSLCVTFSASPKKVTHA